MASPRPSADDLRLLDPDGTFIQRLAADRTELTRLLAPAELPAIRVVVHRLAGAAGTFGFAEIGDIAIALDDRFADGDPVGPADIQPLLAALARALDG